MKNLPHVGFTSPTEWNPSIKNDDHRTSEEMIKQFPVVPQEAINEFYNQKGNVNHEYPRRNRKAKTTDIENESDDSVDPDMPGLQPRLHEDTSGDNSDCDKKYTKTSTTMN